ncbi:MAG: serine/threonine protein kinase [Bacteroidales bacterium]|nr:serine/threonine protein kinase [Lachnoclostridium sp.]MCM1385606.1 serine/threonine protein kinase [Lachnoclostridium sp.]MCM1466323.1 serine/threonine protein kinase [Bacteroidales bacterium]
MVVIMEYEEIKLLKQSDKSTVYLVRQKPLGGVNQEAEQLFIKKTLKGRHPIYEILQKYPHPNLPKLYEVSVLEDSTVVMEEYIEGKLPDVLDLSKEQFLNVVRSLCSVLEFIHGKGIIHRDIKPSNIILTEDGHVYLIDFDAARMPKEEVEKDTKLLGTRGFAPPEQYGFAQTDERTDIYALGVTLNQIMGEKNRNPRYKKIIRKCMNLDPDKRYQSVKQVKRAFFHTKETVLCGAAVLLVLALAGYGIMRMAALRGGTPPFYNAGAENGLTVLPVPQDVHWDGDTGNATWQNVPESGVGDEVQFYIRVYRRDISTSPDVEDDDYFFEDKIRMGSTFRDLEYLSENMAKEFTENGFYYFSVAAVGDGIHYTDSAYAMSDAFEYTGESAPPLPLPEGLEWKMYNEDNDYTSYATWSNLDDYEDKDSFNVTVYNEAGEYVTNNIWSKEQVVERGYGGIVIRPYLLIPGENKRYRFTVQAYSSRPNEYSSSPMPDPVPEEYYSPWLLVK